MISADTKLFLLQCGARQRGYTIDGINPDRGIVYDSLQGMHRYIFIDGATPKELARYAQEVGMLTASDIEPYENLMEAVIMTIGFIEKVERYYVAYNWESLGR